MGFEEPPVHCSMLFEPANEHITAYEGEPELNQYVEFIVFFSGGKDSIACALHLIERGVPPSKVEIHHHLVDGKEGSTLMDWDVTEDYCKKFAEAFGMRYVATWREGGIEREMLRDNSPTAAVMIPDENGGTRAVGGNGPNGTRRKFPQVSASLSTRYCSSYGKIDVGARYLTNTARFQDGQRRLVITGERAEESPSRAKYATFFAHAQDNRDGKKSQRYIDHWRAVHRWSEADVWAIMERHLVNCHPAYKIGFSRCSCSTCVFIANDNWATIKVIAPSKFKRIADYEAEFGITIHRSLTVNQRAEAGSVMPDAAKYGPVALSKEFLEPIIVSDWKLPAGAFKGNGGRF